MITVFNSVRELVCYLASIDHIFYKEEGCKRDFDKEEWAIKRGLCVVRVLQEDIYIRMLLCN